MTTTNLSNQFYRLSLQNFELFSEQVLHQLQTSKVPKVRNHKSIKGHSPAGSNHSKLHVYINLKFKLA